MYKPLFHTYLYSTLSFRSSGLYLKTHQTNIDGCWQGIWSSNPSLLSSLGEDKTGTFRVGVVLANASCNGSSEKPKGRSCQIGDVTLPSPSRRLPAGLKNLGATCYLNSQLQALFANKDFRKGVYAWRPPKGGGL